MSESRVRDVAIDRTRQTRRVCTRRVGRVIIRHHVPPCITTCHLDELVAAARLERFGRVLMGEGRQWGERGAGVSATPRARDASRFQGRVERVRREPRSPDAVFWPEQTRGGGRDGLAGGYARRCASAFAIRFSLFIRSAPTFSQPCSSWRSPYITLHWIGLHLQQLEVAAVVGDDDAEARCVDDERRGERRARRVVLGTRESEREREKKRA